MSHRVEWTLDDLGVTATFTCTAPDGADCRTICARGCDDGCSPDNDGTPHERMPIDYCNPCEWLNDVSYPSDQYAGKRTGIRDGNIALTWTGSDYQWDYIPEETT